MNKHFKTKHTINGSYYTSELKTMSVLKPWLTLHERLRAPFYCSLALIVMNTALYHCYFVYNSNTGLLSEIFRTFFWCIH